MRTILPIILLVAAMLSPQQGQAKAISAQSVLQAGISIVDSEVSNDITYADAVTLEEAVRRVRQQYGGRIVSAETRRSGDRRMHVIKVLTKDGRVRTVRIAAE